MLHTSIPNELDVLAAFVDSVYLSHSFGVEINRLDLHHIQKSELFLFKALSCSLKTGQLLSELFSSLCISTKHVVTPPLEALKEGQ